MAKRFTDTELWDKKWFMALSPKEKCLARFIFDKCDAAGIWSPNWALASAYIGETVDLMDLKNFSYRLEFLGEKIFVADFIEFQYGELSENCIPHKKIIATLKKFGLFDRVSKGYIKGTETLKEKDKEEEKEEDQDFGKSENLSTASGSIVTEMSLVWQKTFPKYSQDVKRDAPALREIAEFVLKDAGMTTDLSNPDLPERLMAAFQLIADQVNREPFWRNKPLKAIASNIQEFTNKIKNPDDGSHSGNSKTGKPGTSEARIAAARKF